MANDDQERSNPMADLVGPFYKAESVAAMLRCSVHRLDLDAAEGRLLQVRTIDNVDLYPTFQFGPDGTVREELKAVLSGMVNTPCWSAAVWLRTSNAALGGQSPEQAAADRTLAALLQQLARQWAGDVTR